MFHPPNQARWHQLVDVPLPRGVGVERFFPASQEPEGAGGVRGGLLRPGFAGHWRPGLSVAIGVGSRGLAELEVLVAATVATLRDAGCQPFVVPAMGSHGGATSAGQQQLLAEYGITEATIGAPIRASMDVVEIGTFGN